MYMYLGVFGHDNFKGALTATELKRVSSARKRNYRLRDEDRGFTDDSHDSKYLLILVTENFYQPTKRERLILYWYM